MATKSSEAGIQVLTRAFKTWIATPHSGLAMTKGTNPPEAVDPLPGMTETVSMHEIHLPCNRHRLHAIAGLQFGVDVAQMRSHRGFGTEQFIGHFVIG